MSRRVTILLHGPYVNSNYRKIISAVNKIKHVDIHIVSVVYEADRQKYQKVLGSIQSRYPIDTFYVKDLFNPGYFNINRQIWTVSKGLEHCLDNSYVIKLRNDQWVNFNKLIRILGKERLFESTKVVTTNCYTRKYRLYHPSDMFLCGKLTVLKQYYSVPLMEETELDITLRQIKEYEDMKDKSCFHILAPENILFSNYIDKNGWERKNTYQDSYEAIRKYCYVLNSWNIGLKWNKDRPPYSIKGRIIYPYYGKDRIFGIIEENQECYQTCDFVGRKTIKDYVYTRKSRKAFLENGRRFYKLIGIKVVHVIGRLMPDSVRKRLERNKVWYRYQEMKMKSYPELI